MALTSKEVAKKREEYEALTKPVLAKMATDRGIEGFNSRTTKEMYISALLDADKKGAKTQAAKTAAAPTRSGEK